MTPEATERIIQDRPAKVIGPNDRPWLKFPGLTVDLKILHVDEERNIAVLLSRIGAGGEGGKHLHLCEAIAYTMSGEWSYDDSLLPTGAVAIEPFGSIHTPLSDSGSEQFVVFVGSGPDLIQALDEDGNIVATTTIKHLKLLYDMTPEEAARFGLVSDE